VPSIDALHPSMVGLAHYDASKQMIPLGRMGVPDDIGRVALFLLSGLADYVTGAQVVVDGGRLLA
jgi:2-dehydro-3-deoxy-D-gluconate 5-dehydrogenase